MGTITHVELADGRVVSDGNVAFDALKAGPLPPEFRDIIPDGSLMAPKVDERQVPDRWMKTVEPVSAPLGTARIVGTRSVVLDTVFGPYMPLQVFVDRLYATGAEVDGIEHTVGDADAYLVSRAIERARALNPQETLRRSDLQDRKQQQEIKQAAWARARTIADQEKREAAERADRQDRDNLVRLQQELREKRLALRVSHLLKTVPFGVAEPQAEWEMRQSFVRAKAAGVPVSEIARSYGCSTSYIYRQISRQDAVAPLQSFLDDMSHVKEFARQIDFQRRREARALRREERRKQQFIAMIKALPEVDQREIMAALLEADEPIKSAA